MSPNEAEVKMAEIKFEEALKKLEKIVSDLETGDMFTTA